MNSNNRKRKARRSREETLSAFCQKVTKYFDRRSDLTSVKSFKRQNASSRFFGVMYIKSQKKWRAQICAAGTKQYVGNFDTEVEAAYARDKTFIDLFGDEDKLALNFPGYWVSREAHERENIHCSDSPFGEEVVSREAHERENIQCSDSLFGEEVVSREAHKRENIHCSDSLSNAAKLLARDNYWRNKETEE